MDRTTLATSELGNLDYRSDILKVAGIKLYATNEHYSIKCAALSESG